MRRDIRDAIRMEHSKVFRRQEHVLCRRIRIRTERRTRSETLLRASDTQGRSAGRPSASEGPEAIAEARSSAVPWPTPLGRPREAPGGPSIWNGSEQPLDVYVRDTGEWFAWNEWRQVRDEFNREFSYTVEELPAFAPFVGRLKIGLPKPPRGRSFRLERYLKEMAVVEVLREPYCG